MTVIQFKTLLLNSADNISASWVELADGKVNKVLWEYNLPYDGKFADAELIDVKIKKDAGQYD